MHVGGFPLLFRSSHFIPHHHHLHQLLIIIVISQISTLTMKESGWMGTDQAPMFASSSFHLNRIHPLATLSYHIIQTSREWIDLSTILLKRIIRSGWVRSCQLNHSHQLEVPLSPWHLWSVHRSIHTRLDAQQDGFGVGLLAVSSLVPYTEPGKHISHAHLFHITNATPKPTLHQFTHIPQLLLPFLHQPAYPTQLNTGQRPTCTYEGNVKMGRKYATRSTTNKPINNNQPKLNQLVLLSINGWMCWIDSMNRVGKKRKEQNQCCPRKIHQPLPFLGNLIFFQFSSNFHFRFVQDGTSIQQP